MITVAPQYGVLILLGFLSSISILIVMWRINIRRFMGYPACCDLAVCLFLMDIFAGSFGGMCSAIFASLFFSAGITVARKLFGYERFNWRQRQWVSHDGYLQTRAQRTHSLGKPAYR